MGWLEKKYQLAVGYQFLKHATDKGNNVYTSKLELMKEYNEFLLKKLWKIEKNYIKSRIK